MPQSFSHVAIHLIFSTKDRERAIAYPELRNKLEAYIVGILKNTGCLSISTRVLIYHVHILYFQSRTETTAKVVQLVKQETSKWIKTQNPDIKDPFLIKFHWQKGYSAYSVSASIIPKVKKDIANQEEHHQRTTFKEEYLEFLEKHNLAYDERYVWD